MSFPFIKLIILFLTVFSGLYTVVTTRYSLLPYNLLLIAASCAVLGYGARKLRQTQRGFALYIVAAVIGIFAITYLCT